MNSAIVSRVLGRRSYLETLRCLTSSQESLSGREIARRAGLTHTVVQQALEMLEREGLTRRQFAAPAHLFSLNRRHWAAVKVFIPLFASEKTWREHLAEVLFGPKGGPAWFVSSVLYGSAARGKLDRGSDIDVLLVVRGSADRESAEQLVDEKAEEALSAFGHPISAIVLAVSDFRLRFAKKDPWAREIVYSGLVLRGRLLTEVLHDER